MIRLRPVKVVLAHLSILLTVNEFKWQATSLSRSYAPASNLLREPIREQPESLVIAVVFRPAWRKQTLANRELVV